ncbi:hypothetical protein PG994_009386 [Apiospora phragmitis]|uniref:Uncharacterized protein n=1 Tax=Apiospora phragmitis TaxID=2905665 RepID=A0ABR1UM10_9PEZI
MQPVVYQRDGSPTNEHTSILVSLLLLDWPELAKKFLLSTLAPKDRKVIWKDEFSLERRPQKDFATTSDLVIQPQTTILKACVALQPHSGNDPAAPEEFPITDSMLKILLDAGANPCPPDYLYTPLQHVVSHLEESWVHTIVHRLQYHRNGDINMVGTPGGEHPYNKDAENCDKDEFWWCNEHPLEICRSVVPDWEKEAGEDVVDQARTQIDLLLRQFGAFETDKGQPRGGQGVALVVNVSDDGDDALA